MRKNFLLIFIDLFRHLFVIFIEQVSKTGHKFFNCSQHILQFNFTTAHRKQTHWYIFVCAEKDIHFFDQKEKVKEHITGFIFLNQHNQQP